MKQKWKLGASAILMGIGLTGGAEARDLTPPAAFYQRAPQLNDLWQDHDNSHSSELCFATSIANVMRYLRDYRRPAVKQLKVPYSQNGGNASSYDYVRYFVDLCGTDVKDGTWWVDAPLCMQTYFLHSHLKESTVKVVGKWGVGTRNNNYNLPVDQQVRAITLLDIQRAIDAKLPVLVTVSWMQKQKDGKWQRKGGHAIVIYGYDDEDPSTVMITDPWRKYPNPSGKYSDRVKLSRAPEFFHRQGFNWILDSPTYNRGTVIGAIDSIFIAKPGVPQ